jgi:hypothetical protein
VPEPLPAQLPFRVEFDVSTGQVVVWKTYGIPPRQTMRRKEIDSLEALAAEVAIHRDEAFLQHNLAQTLASAAVQHLGADPGRLEGAVKALSDPTSTTPVSQILHRGTVAPWQTG